MSKLYEALIRGENLIPNLIPPPLPGEEAGAAPSGADLPNGMPDYLADMPLEVSGMDPLEAPVATPVLEPLARVRKVRLHVVANSPILPFDGTNQRAGEQYRLLRTRLAQHPKRPQMIVITSVGPADGKTVTSINLAGALALKNEARVLLLEGDFRRSMISAQLGMEATPGIAEVLQGQCELTDAIVQAEQIPQLYILPVGTTRVNPSELLDSSIWTSVCQTCRSNFDYIIVDSPPQGAVADYDLLQAACDGVIVVVRPDYTDRKRTVKTLQDVAKDKLLGVVVNSVHGMLLDRDRNRYGAYYKGIH